MEEMLSGKLFADMTHLTGHEVEKESVALAGLLIFSLSLS